MAANNSEAPRPLIEAGDAGPQHMTTGRATAWLSLGIVLILIVTAAQLRMQGRVFWCQCDRTSLWSGEVLTSHNSQHLADPYSITHISHGLLLYGLFAWLTPRLAAGWRLGLALVIEAAWEIIENTNFVIERYREATASLDYFGDSIANAMGDIAFCGIGFLLARRLGLWGSIGLLVFAELVLLFWIRDNLFLNVLMLFLPIEALKTWQLNAG